MHNRRVLVFGVFDAVHAGHRHFLAKAREHGDELIVVVARDAIVRELKNKTPRHSQEERRLAVAQVTAVTCAVLGDAEQGTYDVIKKYQPAVICLGYDQDALAEDLENRMASDALPSIPIHRIASHKPEQWHTTLLTKSPISASIE